MNIEQWELKHGQYVVHVVHRHGGVEQSDSPRE